MPPLGGFLLRGGEKEMKKLVILVAGVVFLIATTPTLAIKPTDKGFDEFGYNYHAGNFVGTGSEWCQGKLGWTESDCNAHMGIYANDHLKMKWSKAWDDARFHEGEWTCDAWVDNQWNGAFPGGSGEVWHSRIVWVGPELEDSDCWRDGGVPIWGSFETLMDHGTFEGMHEWLTHSAPSGYGGF